MQQSARIRYIIPAGVWGDLAWAILLHRRRAFRTDARRMVSNLNPPPRLLGEEHIPRQGPGLITLNHYWSPGFWAPWMAAVVCTVVPVEVYWTMAGALTFPGWRLRGPLRWCSQRLIGEVARVYGINTMPPMPPDPREAAERAASIRRIVRYAREHPGAFIAMAPEGGDQPGGRLTLGPEGAGRLALAITAGERPVYPVGIYEEDGCLTLRFGRPYMLVVDNGLPRNEQDYQVRQVMMRAVAGLLPERLRGELG